MVCFACSFLCTLETSLFLYSLCLLQTISLQLGIADKVILPSINQFNKTQADSGQSKREYYAQMLRGVNPDTLSFLLNIHRLDFELFGYDLEGIEDILRSKQS